MLKFLLQATVSELKYYLGSSVLPKYYKIENIKVTENYIFAEGKIPVILVAHLDTVAEKPPEKLYIDKKEQIVFGENIIGADDRAGVYGILKLLEDGYLPHVVFCDKEEIGAEGAFNLITDYPKCPFQNVKYMIELDRQGEHEFTTYHCSDKKFDRYISSFGWSKVSGIFSDISVIAPAWGIAACNCSIGFINEHTSKEMLYIEWLNRSIGRIAYMFSDIDNIKPFEYKVKKKHFFK